MQRFHEEIKDNIDHEFVIYKRKVGFPPDPSNKWLANPGAMDTYPEYYTGLVQYVIIDKCGYIWIGMSQCSKHDTFNKKIGRAIARGRAEKAYHLYHSKHFTSGCWECEHYDSVATVLWLGCRHPEKYTIGEEKPVNGDTTDLSMMTLDWLPDNYTDNGCPLDSESIWTSLKQIRITTGGFLKKEIQGIMYTKNRNRR